jgi:hypothetical protein
MAMSILTSGFLFSAIAAYIILYGALPATLLFSPKIFPEINSSRRNTLLRVVVESARLPVRCLPYRASGKAGSRAYYFAPFTVQHNNEFLSHQNNNAYEEQHGGLPCTACASECI